MGGDGADYRANDDDRIVGTADAVYIAASGGDDVVDGHDRTIRTDAGDDRIRASDGYDRIDAGGGDDRFLHLRLLAR